MMVKAKQQITQKNSLMRWGREKKMMRLKFKCEENLFSYL
jgi:hypothetical protein